MDREKLIEETVNDLRTMFNMENAFKPFITRDILNNFASKLTAWTPVVEGGKRPDYGKTVCVIIDDGGGMEPVFAFYSKDNLWRYWSYGHIIVSTVTHYREIELPEVGG